MMALQTETSVFQRIFDASLPAITGFIGILTGAWLTSRRERAARRHRFIERQIDEFYSPLVGIRSEIRTKSELRVKIDTAAHSGMPHGESLADLKKRIEYDNRQLVKELLPAYSRMLKLFRDRMWLAEESTRKHYSVLVEFVEIWNRLIRESLAVEVLRRLNHTEEALKPLYEDLEGWLRALREKIAKGKV